MDPNQTPALPLALIAEGAPTAALAAHTELLQALPPNRVPNWAREAGIDQHLGKPVMPMNLMSLLKADQAL